MGKRGRGLPPQLKVKNAAKRNKKEKKPKTKTKAAQIKDTYSEKVILEGKDKLFGLTKWLIDNGVWINMQHIDLKSAYNGSGYGYSVIARSDISVGTSLARIPKKIVLSVKASGVREEIESAMLIGEIATALALLFEISKGKDSFWFTYLDSLPEMEPLPYFWTDEEREPLKGTDAEKIIAKYPGLLKDDYESLVVPLLEAHPKKFPKDFFTFDRVFKAMTLVSSRAFNVDSYHGDSMVPLADLFNHKSGAESVHFESVDVCAVCGAVGGCEHEGHSDEEFDEEEGDGDDDGHGHGGDEDGSEHDGSEHDDKDEDGDDQSESDKDSENASSSESVKNDSENDSESNNEGASDSDSDDEPSNKKEVPIHYENSDDDPAPDGKSDVSVVRDDEIEMVSVLEVKRNREIFNTFGELSNSCLITKYGFTELDNPYDTVDLKVSLILSALSSDTFKERFELASKLLKQKVYEVGYDGHVEENLVKVLRICSLPDEEYSSWKKLSKDKQREYILDGRVKLILSGKKGAQLAQIVLDIMEERKKRYPSTLKQDEKSLTELEGNARYSLILRVSERRILQRGENEYSAIKESCENFGLKKKEAKAEATAVVATTKTKKSKVVVEPILKPEPVDDGSKTPKLPRTSKYKRKKDRLRAKRKEKDDLALTRAKLALKKQKKQHEALEKKLGYKLPPALLFPLDLRPGARPRPLIFPGGVLPAPPETDDPDPYHPTKMLAKIKRKKLTNRPNAKAKRRKRAEESLNTAE